MPKKILIITECFYPEEFKINDVALAWKKKGYDVSVLTLVPSYPLGEVFSGYKNKIFQREKYQGINIYRLFTCPGYRECKIKKLLKYLSFMVFGAIAAISIGRRYDYIFGFNLGALTDMFPAVLIRKLYKKPTMLWIHDVWPDSVYAYGFKKTKLLSFILENFVKFILKDISSIAISSKGFEEKLKPYVKKNIKFGYAPNWADDLTGHLPSISLSKSRKIHFTFAGNIGKFQNLENIINAFLLLPNEYKKKSQLNIIGDGSNKVDLIKLTKNSPYVIFHGKKLRKDMAKFYKASNFLIISLIDKPIFSVTVPAKLQTYIAAKKPILAIINGDSADIVNEYNLGICADPSNIKLIKDAFKKCCDMSESEKNKFINNNAMLSKTIFDKDFVVNNLTNQLLGKQIQ